MMPAVCRRMIVISSGLGREHGLQASAQGACSTHFRDGLSAASHVVENALHSERGMRSVVPCGGSSGSSVEEASVWPTKAPHLKQPGYPKRQCALHLENKATSSLSVSLEWLPSSFSSAFSADVLRGEKCLVSLWLAGDVSLIVLGGESLGCSLVRKAGVDHAISYVAAGGMR